MSLPRQRRTNSYYDKRVCAAKSAAPEIGLLRPRQLPTPVKGVRDSSSRASRPGVSSPVIPDPAVARSQPHLRIDGRAHAGEGVGR